MWIAIYVYLLPDLMHYMDDAWSYEMDPMLAFYEPYDAWFPLKQVKLLQLYHELGLPHVQKKQQFGRTLEIIGLVVNPINMTITMSDKSCSDLTSAICAFIDSSLSRQCPVIEWQHILGWINWGLNAYPLLRPALQPTYGKFSGKQISRAQVYLNRTVIRHFNWLADTIDISDGVHMLDAEEWGISNVDLITYTDMSLTGLGFTTPTLKLGFCSSIPAHSPLTTIFYFEALAITSAILWASGLEPGIRRLLIFTDSLNCVDMFNSLRAQEGYNDILLFVVRILISSKISLRVFHIPGADNCVTDALSHHLFDMALTLSPGLNIHHFQPPRDAMGLAE